MADTQVKGGVTPTPNGEYVVVSNGGASNYYATPGNPHPLGTITAGAPGYDDGIFGGTTSQGTNPYKNGTIPDFLTTGTTSTAGVTFRNPIPKGN